MRERSPPRNAQDAAQSISSIEEMVQEARAGRMFILVDHEGRDYEGALVLPAGDVDPQTINFMATWGRGLICLALTGQRVNDLGLPMMPTRYQEGADASRFTISIEAKEGITTGISAYDRARTIQVAADASCGADDIVTPGHVFPLRTHDAGVLGRAGLAEASVDICRVAGLPPAAVICVIMRDNGQLRQRSDLMIFAGEHDLKIGLMSDLIARQRKHYLESVHVSKVNSG